jgi:hypothetical protein
MILTIVKIIDSRVNQSNIEYLVHRVSGSERDLDREWIPIDSFRNGLGAGLLMWYEAVKQGKLTEAFYKSNKTEITKKYSKKFIGITHDRVVCVSDDQEEIFKKMALENDVLAITPPVERGNDIVYQNARKRKKIIK